MRADKWYQRNAWMFLFAMGVFFVINGIAHIVLGLTGGTEGGIGSLDKVAASKVGADYIKMLTFQNGLLGLLSAILVIGITLKSYRKGERWAWYVLWSPVAFAVTAQLVPFGEPAPGHFGICLPCLVVAILPVLGLLLPYRKFFLGRPTTP